MNVPLGEMIAALRAELQAALLAGKDSPIRFGIERIELELAIEVERSQSGDGKVQFKLFGLGAEGGGNIEARRANTQTFKIVLNAHDPLSSPLTINSERHGLGPG